MPRPQPQPWCTPVVIHPVVDGRTGEFGVKLNNASDRPLGGGRLSLRDHGTPGAPLFDITPPIAHGAYTLEAIPPGGVQRTFCLRPVHAEVGKTYVIDVVFEPTAEGGAGERRRAGGALQPQVMQFRVEVQARPEVYAAIGAVEALREGLLGRYRKLIEKGHAAHQRTESMLPSSSTDRLEVTLGERSFDFLLQAVDLGLRVVQAPAQRRPSPRRTGGNSNEAPPS